MSIPETSRLPMCLALCLAVFAPSGCATMGGRTVQLQMVPGDRCLLSGKAVPVSRLPRALAAHGAREETRIRVLLAKHTDFEAIKRLSRTLSTAGYRKIHFVTPRQAISFTASGKQTH